MERDTLSDNWREYSDEIQSRIDNEGVQHYRKWSVIQKTMVREDAWDTIIEREQVREKLSYLNDDDLSLGTAVQQYHALITAGALGIPTLGIKHLVEIGGGIGEMAYCASKIMPNLLSHIIYDIEPVCRIQQYRFSMDRMRRSSSFSDLDTFMERVGKIFANAKPSEILFVSICALSEMPVSSRDRILRMPDGQLLLKNSILRVQDRWDGIDNIGYFLSLINPGEHMKVARCVFADHKYLVRSIL